MTDVIHQMLNSVWGTPKHERTRSPSPTPVPFDQTFQHSTHATLNAVTADVSPTSSHISVSILDGSSGKKVKLQLLETDTVGKVKELLKEGPMPGQSLELACNGKPVVQHQTLKQLCVLGQVTFITYRKCVGG